jgi:hypothetical protein
MLIRDNQSNHITHRSATNNRKKHDSKVGNLMQLSDTMQPAKSRKRSSIDYGLTEDLQIGINMLAPTLTSCMAPS